MKMKNRPMGDFFFHIFLEDQSGYPHQIMGSGPSFQQGCQSLLQFGTSEIFGDDDPFRIDEQVLGDA